MRLLPRIAALTVIAALSGSIAAAQEKAAANPEGIEIGLSTDRVAITADFTGADLTIFGALDNADPLVSRQGRYDVIMVLGEPRARRCAAGPHPRHVDQHRIDDLRERAGVLLVATTAHRRTSRIPRPTGTRSAPTDYLQPEERRPTR